MSQKHLQTMFIKSILHTVLLLSAACLSTFCADAASTSDGGNLLPEGHSSRRTLSLDGQWQVAEGKSDVPPTVFAHTVPVPGLDRKSTRLNSSHLGISYAVFCLKK